MMGADGHNESVSVLVPARNEEENLAACLGSLVRQDGIAYEIIVIDDHSTDRTAEIASRFHGVRLVKADELPEGWCGKQHALECGVRHAGGEWLLFTDADTVHQPGSLRQAVNEAREHGADLLSYSPAQEVRTFWELALMPVVFAELARTYRPGDVCNPESPVAAANGQYLLIRRAAYDRIGGHAAVRNTLLEDVALARNVKQGGGRLRFRYGGDAVSARMYRTLGAMCEGWTKNLAVLFPRARRLAGLRMLEFVAIVGFAASTAVSALRGEPAVAIVAGLGGVVVYAGFLRRVVNAHFGRAAGILALAGLPIFSLFLLRSAIYYGSGRAISWRGREYRWDSSHRSAFSSQPENFLAGEAGKGARSGS
ncbi:MAG: glycosyltransferase [Acidobacteria bacterium]|nr:glycosyltransferase [Acidobacteriota bacterium]